MAQLLSRRKWIKSRIKILGSNIQCAELEKVQIDDRLKEISEIETELEIEKKELYHKRCRLNSTIWSEFVKDISERAHVVGQVDCYVEIFDSETRPTMFEYPPGHDCSDTFVVKFVYGDQPRQ